MRKDFPIDIDLEMADEFTDDFGDLETPEGERETESMTVTPIHDEWNIVKAFNKKKKVLVYPLCRSIRIPVRQIGPQSCSVRYHRHARGGRQAHVVPSNG